MIAGEPKSGKSTFINACLGEKLLPMDVKQCTSAIVEIKYGDAFSVKATYADGCQKIWKQYEILKNTRLVEVEINDRPPFRPASS